MYEGGQAAIALGRLCEPRGRMLEVLRKSAVLRLEGNKTVALKNIRPAPGRRGPTNAELRPPVLCGCRRLDFR